MRQDDLDTVMTIEALAYAYPWTRGNFADSLEAGYDAQVWEQEQQIYAYHLILHAPDVDHILNFCVARTYQRQGLGARLLDCLLLSLRDRGSDAVVLEVRPSNLAAIRLYERAGFARIGLRRGYYPAARGQREDAIVMRRDLTPRPGPIER